MHCHKWIPTTVKLHEIHFYLLPDPPHSQDLAPSNYWLYIDHKMMLQKRRFNCEAEVISETESKAKLFYKKGIEILKKGWNENIILEGDYVDE